MKVVAINGVPIHQPPPQRTSLKMTITVVLPKEEASGKEVAVVNGFPGYCCATHGAPLLGLQQRWAEGYRKDLNYYREPGEFLEFAVCMGNPRKCTKAGVPEFAESYVDDDGTIVPAMLIRQPCKRPATGFGKCRNLHDDVCYMFCKQCLLDYASMPEGSSVAVVCNNCLKDLSHEMVPQKRASRRG
jgi:hypothetical protein